MLVQYARRLLVKEQLSAVTTYGVPSTLHTSFQSSGMSEKSSFSQKNSHSGLFISAVISAQ